MLTVLLCLTAFETIFNGFPCGKEINQCFNIQDRYSEHLIPLYRGYLFNLLTHWKTSRTIYFSASGLHISGSMWASGSGEGPPVTSHLLHLVMFSILSFRSIDRSINLGLETGRNSSLMNMSRASPESFKNGLFQVGHLTKCLFSTVTQSCPTLCDPIDCSTPGFPVHHQLPGLA